MKCPRCSKVTGVTRINDRRAPVAAFRENVIEHDMKETIGYIRSETGKTFVSYTCVNCGYTELYRE